MPLDFPSDPIDGQVYDIFYWDESMSVWRATGSLLPLVPPGVISQYAGSTAPSGYLLCDGQSLLTSSYPGLFSAIGYQYGGSGPNFNVPNLQNRIPVGKGSETEFDTLGETGGSKTHTLTVNEMPSHTHTQDAHNHTQNSHNHTFRMWVFNGANPGAVGNKYGVGYAANTGGQEDRPSYGTGELVWGNFPATATNVQATATNQNTGGGLAHNNLQPYIVLNYIIKT